MIKKVTKKNKNAKILAIYDGVGVVDFKDQIYFINIYELEDVYEMKVNLKAGDILTKKDLFDWILVMKKKNVKKLCRILQEK